jgi:two-component system response regulator
MEIRTVLLAEDDSSHAALIGLALKRIGLNSRLDIVSTGKEVLEYLFGSDPSGVQRPMPDLILLDLRMPQMSGLQVLSALRSMRESRGLKYPPIVVLSSSRDEADILEAYRLGAHSFIPKPASFSELMDAVRQVLQYWIGLNESPRLLRRGDSSQSRRAQAAACCQPSP